MGGLRERLWSASPRWRREGRRHLGAALEGELGGLVALGAVERVKQPREAGLPRREGVSGAVAGQVWEIFFFLVAG